MSHEAGPSYEPEDLNIAWWEGNDSLIGQAHTDELTAQYEDLIASKLTDVDWFAEWSAFKKLAKQEHDELVNKYQEAKWETISVSQYQREDLIAEFGEDINGLKMLASYKSIQWYTEFMNLFSSPQISEQEREELYDLVVNEKRRIDRFIQRNLAGEMFPDSESVQDLLAQNTERIDVDEINEAIDMDVSQASESELEYLDKKIDGLISQWVSQSFESKLINKKDEISIQMESLVTTYWNDIEETKSTVEKIVVLEEEATARDEEANRVESEATAREEEARKLSEIRLVEEVKTTRLVISSMVNLIESKWLNISPDLQILLRAATSEDADITIMENAQKEVKEFLKTNPWAIRDLLSQAKSTRDISVLRQTQQFLGALAQGDPEFQNLIKQAELELGLSNMGNQWEIREAQATAYFGGKKVEVSDIEIDGQTYTLDDLEIDASDVPPRAYVLWEDGLKLELGLPDLPSDKETLAVRRDFAQTQIELNSRLQEVSGEYKEKQGKLNRLNQLEQAKQDGERLSPEQEQELSSLKQEEKQLKEEVAALKIKIEWIYSEASNASKAFESAMSQLQFDYEKIQKQQETARFSLALMKSFWIEKIGQDRFNQIIEEVKDGQLIVDIDSPNSFDPKKINIAEWTFGEVQWEPGGENFRENLVRFVNLMYFWNSEWKTESWEQIWMNIQIFKRASEIDNVPGQDPSLVSNMESAWIITSTWDLNVDKARKNLNNGI